MSIYSELAPWYDRLFPVSEAQADFLVDRLRAAGVRRVLDAGCGTGRHLEILADRGFSVAGLEPEPAMAAEANRRLAGRGTVHVLRLQEARELPATPFDALLCLGNTLAHLADEATLAEGLDAVAAALRPGGLFIAQLVHFEKVLREGRDPFADRKLEGKYIFGRRYGFDRSPERLAFSLSFTGPGVDFRETISLRPWTLAELEPAFAEANLEVSDLFGDWSGARRGPDSPATIILALRG